MAKKLNVVLVLFLVLSMALPLTQPASAQTAGTVSFTILHTNDFHGQLEASGSNPGLARTAAVINGVRDAKGAANVLLLDGGDEMQGSLLSNLQKGAPVIEAFNTMGYNAATFGNHEFDWGQDNLTARTTQATYPFLASNLVVNDTNDCSKAGWTAPAFAHPYTVLDVAGVKVGVIGVTTTETPTITVATATQGLCFKDPTSSVLHYYDEVKAASDVVIILSHLGYTDGGYGYGLPVIGDQTLAKNLINAGKPVPLIIGGHSHTNVTTPATITVSGKAGSTVVTQAYYNGRAVGQADLTLDTGTGAVTVAWQKLAVSTTGAEDPDVKAVITTYASDPAYVAKVSEPIGYTDMDLQRLSGQYDNSMGTFVDDAIMGYLNSDNDPTNDIDLFFNNAGGIRTDWCAVEDTANPGTFKWSSTASDCKTGLYEAQTVPHGPMLLNYGNMFTILPFGNATVVGEMTGAQILEVLNAGPLAGTGPIQPSGIKYTYYKYVTGTTTFAWGAFDAQVYNKATKTWEPLDLNKTYKVGTNEFLAPAGGDGYNGFKYMKNITYWGDMLDKVNGYVTQNYGTTETAYKGPSGDGVLDNRIVRDGTNTPDSGTIKPITILHHNDMHGNLPKTNYVGYTQLASLIKQERALNPARTLLLNGGDAIQGDAMMYYFKSAPSGFAADGTPLPAELQTHPMIAALNSMNYDAFVLGNHEFNFGNAVFKGIMYQANFPILGANVADDGQYGLQAAQGGAGVKPYVEKDLDGIKVGIIGITNHRVPNYELPSNIPGLTFSDPLAKAQEEATLLRDTNNDDVVIALTHIGFTEDPKSVEVDKNVDTNLAKTVTGVDAIIGSHSHTSPVTAYGDYKYLPTIVSNPDGKPVIINQAYRYNNYLGEVILGVRAKETGGYEVVSETGKYLTVTNTGTATPEDAATKAIIDPYAAQLASYNTHVVGQTTAPIDTLKAYTEETNGANLQADAAVWELNQHGINPDIHLSGAMTNKKMADGATVDAPKTLTIADMFAGMPYENSLVTLRMNGPQLKAVLERAYRNYYYYKYVQGYGGYSYYTTCMIDTNSIGKIMYRDTNPELPNGDNVVALFINGNPVNFADANTYYLVSTVNYLAAGSCNFNDAGKSLWPLDQIVNDSQLYVRDAVIDYMAAMGTVSPAIEGRLQFSDTDNPTLTVATPTSGTYTRTQSVTVDYATADAGSGLKSVVARFDGKTVSNSQVIDLLYMGLGQHVLTVTSTDWYGNTTVKQVAINLTANLGSMKATITRLTADGQINPSTATTLTKSLTGVEASLKRGQKKVAINSLNAFINTVKAQQKAGRISAAAANVLMTDAKFVASTIK